MNRLLLTFAMLLLSLFPAFLQAKDTIAKIDLSLAMSLHPQMSLFDFDRMGFFKVKQNLDEQQFSQAIADLKTSPNSNKSLELVKAYESEIAAIEQERAAVSAKLYEVSQQQGELLAKQVEDLAARQETLRTKISDVNYQLECPELTSPDETRQRLQQIELEVLAAVEKVAKEGDYSVVLNTSTPYLTGYPDRYQSGPMFGQGVPGINNHIFYAFLSSGRPDKADLEVPLSRNAINWLELTSFPGAINLLPIRPWPIVLHGGRSILSDVVKEVYANHRIAADIFATIDSVIHKIETDREYK